MVTEVKKKAINRLQSMYALRAFQDQQYEAGRDAEKEGRPVAWCMLEGWAAPILSALGVQTIFPENYGAVCAASGGAAAFLERAEAEGFPAHLCGYARNHIGYTAAVADLGEIPPGIPGQGMPKPMLLISSTMACDARYKWFQALGRYLNVPTWTLENPAPGARESLMEGAYARTVNLLVKEIQEFVAFLERLLGKKMDWDELERKREGAREVNAMWYEVNALRTARPGPMHSRDLWSSMYGSLFGGASNSKVLIALYRQMYDEVKARVDNRIAGINYEEKYRVTFEGLPPWHSLGFLDKLAERGWNFVTESAYHPGRPLKVDLSGVIDPVERYVRSRYQSLEAHIANEFKPEEATQIKAEIKQKGFSHRLMAKDLRDFQIDGVFMHTLLTCREATSPLYRLRSIYMDAYKVPSLVTEGDIVDVSLFDPADALRKAEAFEETMDYYREVRKKEGLEW